MEYSRVRAGSRNLMLVILGVVAILAGCGDDSSVGPGDDPYVPSDDFVLIPAGTFQMGWGEGHTVILTGSFYMAETEVTNRQFVELAQWAFEKGYCTVTGDTIRDALDGSTEPLMVLDRSHGGISFMPDIPAFVLKSDRVDHPVRFASWYGAAAYCDWLSLQEGLRRAYDHSTWLCNDGDPYDARGFRLPTEAEWEHACRAGTQTMFNTGDCLSSATEANYDGTQPYTGCSAGPYVEDIVAVGSYLPNGSGLYDMHGNLWEWCNDWSDHYTGEDETDPVGPADSDYRIVRGGAWGYPAANCTSASRGGNPPSQTIWRLGFRPVVSKQ